MWHKRISEIKKEIVQDRGSTTLAGRQYCVISPNNVADSEKCVFIEKFRPKFLV